jgi:hypothetical protein
MYTQFSYVFYPIKWGIGIYRVKITINTQEIEGLRVQTVWGTLL